MQRREREVRNFFGGGCLSRRRGRTESGGQVMHQGVLRDDARRAAKVREREEALEASREKQRAYERVQTVAAAPARTTTTTKKEE